MLSSFPTNESEPRSSKDRKHTDVDRIKEERSGKNIKGAERPKIRVAQENRNFTSCPKITGMKNSSAAPLVSQQEL